MNQCGEMDHLDNHRNRDMSVAGFAERICGEGDKGRAQMLALAIYSVFRVGGNVRVKGIHLARQTRADGIQKRLN